jgi:hypothetical protein
MSIKSFKSCHKKIKDCDFNKNKKKEIIILLSYLGFNINNTYSYNNKYDKIIIDTIIEKFNLQNI